MTRERLKKRPKTASGSRRPEKRDSSESETTADEQSPKTVSASRAPSRELPPEPSRSPLIVGIGASAGGLEPLELLFGNVPKGCGLCFVVVQHLSPQHVSMLAELLQRRTTMPVVEARSGLPALADHVYVIPPGTTLGISSGVFQVGPFLGEQQVLIDSFLRSLADDQGERAVGVLLSGSGSDGTIGLRAIQERKGFTLAQDPKTAKYDAMPAAAITASVVHEVMEPEQIPARLMKHVREVAEGRVSLPNPTRAASAPSEEPPSDDRLANALDQICPVLKEKTGHDFSHYKRGTLLRRLRRRLQANRVSLADYLGLLSNNSQEPELLAQEMLIGVTSFFRDPDAFAYLDEHVLPKLLEAGRKHGSVRIWVPACASGEEAYSIGMLVREHLSRLGATPLPVQIFATDIDPQVIVEARHARYPDTVAEQVSPERLARFFRRDTTTFLVGKEVRELCVFSEHSLIRDPPFAGVDLISCRNLLIYLDSELQKKLVPLFHYALRSRGFLFLGSAEGLAGHSELFDAVDKHFRIFQRRESEDPPFVDLPFVGPSVHRALPSRPQTPRIVQNQRQNIAAVFERLMLQEYSQPGVVVNAEGEIICIAGPTGRYLQPPTGFLSTNVLEIAHSGLRIELRTALHASVRNGISVVRDPAPLKIDGATRRVRITVRPLPGVSDEKLFAIILDERTVPEARPGVPIPDGVERESAVEHLESELRTTRAQLRTAVEELEGANQELKASNQELLSTNEEMQSTNEELRSSQEELSSLNEELTTVNSDLARKVDELGQVNSDLANFFASTDVATLFVDRDQRIQRFTPAAKALFRFIDADVSRPVSDFAHRFKDYELPNGISDVLKTLQPAELQVETTDRRSWYLLRILPYTTVDNKIGGVVITLADITRLKRFEAELRQSKEYADCIIETLPVPILILAPDLKVRFANTTFYKQFQVSRPETEGRKIYELGNGEWNIPSLQELLEKVLSQHTTFEGYRVDHVFQGIGRRILLMNGRRLDDMQLILLGINDVTERELTAQNLKQGP